VIAGRITFLGQASFKVETPSGSIALIDPWLKENPLCPPEMKVQPAADLVLVTHGHGDHFDPDLPELLKQTGAAVVAQPQVRAYLAQQKVANIEPMNTGGSMEVRGYRVTMTAAFHNAHISLGEGATGFSHEAVGFVLTTPDGLRIYFAGDTALFGDMRLIGELYHPHIAVLPIGDRFTMGPFEAAHAIRLLGVKHVIPMHYGMSPIFTGTPEALYQHTEDIEGLSIHAIKPGETLDVSILTFAEA
jgi:L-ascorbate metabolism protein UlaG (beta-lactamase superfamily)